MPRKMIPMALFAIAILACSAGGVLINISFQELSGLEKGDRVLYQGNKAGQVQSVTLNGNGSYTAQIKIDEGFANAATEYAEFHLIEDSDQVGRKAIGIELQRTGGKPLANGSTVMGVPLREDLFGKIQGELESGMGFIIDQIDKFGRDIQAIPESQEFQELKKTLENLAAEIEKKEKETREKMKKKWLPKVQRELEALRERLRQKGREDELAPLDQEMERIRRI